MKKSVTIVFTLLFILVLGVYLQLETHDEDVQDKEKAFLQEEMKLLDLKADDRISRIKIQRPEEKQTVVLSRESGIWTLEYPIQFPADPLLAKGFETLLTVSHKVRKLKPEKGWEEYGLKTPALKISVATEKTAKEKTLYLGDQATVGPYLFARWTGEEGYFLLPQEFKAAFGQSLYTLRQKSVFQINAAEISKIHIKSGAQEYELSKNKERWFWMEPIEVLGEFVPEDSMKALLQGLQDLNIKEFLDKPFLDLSKLGLLNSAQTIVVMHGKSEQILEVGKEEPSKESFYAKLDKIETAYLVSSSHLKQFFEAVKKSADQSMPKRPASASAAVAAPPAAGLAIPQTAASSAKG